MEKGYKSLIVWQKALVLAKEAYVISRKLPKSEAFGLASQLTRAAVSIPSNIAEGSRRGTRKEYTQFLRIAHGSLAELETQLEIVDSSYPTIDLRKARSLADEISRMLSVIIKKLHA